jgi:nicotinamide mononucleotide adenylyltransferase
MLQNGQPAEILIQEPESEDDGARGNPTPPEDNSNNGGLDSPPLAESMEESTMRKLAQMRINGKKPRQDSRVRDRETGYDRLNGLNDGEADLDESAPQAEGDGSEAYLRGENGPSGEYHFPTHRLRTTMKGESIPKIMSRVGIRRAHI